jgi:aspartyl-tRNA(Asn)/glutamyl-tRNA(Gln) amidotransferase subunit B
MSGQSKSAKLLKGETGDWEVVIGMEVHAHVISQAKLFSGASTAFGGEPNSHVSLVDAAMPGMLPVINAECVKQAIRTGLGLNARINLKSVFDRKNYFYPDLPQGYQISQYKSPIVGEGEVAVDLPDGETVRIGIERLHLEQDAGKSIHDRDPNNSLVDLNRAGVALMEIVSRPDLRSADEAKAYLGKLRSIMRYLGTCDGNMEEGSLRADVNVSVRRPGGPLGTRAEIKNVNSIRFVGEAIDFEARRQIEIIEDGGKIEQETRLFDPGKGETRSMRNKEEAHDYRYFPDPDLLPLEFPQSFVDELNAHLPELPDAKRSRFITDYRLPAYDADVLVAERVRAEYFELMVKKGAEPREAASWLINEYLGRLNRDQQRPGMPTVNPTIEIISVKVSADVASSRQWEGMPTVNPEGAILRGPVQVDLFQLGPLPAASSAAIVSMIVSGEISRRIAKDVLDYILENPEVDPKEYVERNNLRQVTDTGAIEKIVDDIIAANADKVADAKANPKAIGWFVGQIMKASGGKANPKVVNDLLKRKLGL